MAVLNIVQPTNRQPRSHLKILWMDNESLDYIYIYIRVELMISWKTKMGTLSNSLNTKISAVKMRSTIYILTIILSSCQYPLMFAIKQCLIKLWRMRMFTMSWLNKEGWLPSIINVYHMSQIFDNLLPQDLPEWSSLPQLNLCKRGLWELTDHHQYVSKKMNSRVPLNFPIIHC